MRRVPKEFWYYSLMLFLACRAADGLNAFVGLWMVPKYVSAESLGAVLPLASVASAFAIPASVVALTFQKEVNALALAGDFGRMKSLIRGVFLIVGAFLVLAIGVAWLTLPRFFAHIRVDGNLLGFLIVASAFLGCTAPIYTSALQALKRFKTLSLINLIGAPVRFLAMCLTLPMRALPGYFAGQSAPPAFQILASVFCLRRELSVPAEPYWNRATFARVSALFLSTLAYYGFGTIGCVVEMAVMRGGIPDVESAAYYMTSRFSDIAGFIAMTLTVVLFPYTSEEAEAGRTTRNFVLKSMLVTIGFNAILLVVFLVIGSPALSLLPGGEKYAAYHWAIPWCIAIGTLFALQVFHTNTELSARRYGFLKWWIPLNLAYPALLWIFRSRVTTLSDILWWFTISAALKVGFSLFDLRRR